MSTPNPTHIIAEAVRDGLYEHDAETIAAHVVSELTDAGYSIVPSGRFTASVDIETGFEYDTGNVRAEAVKWFKHGEIDDEGAMLIHDLCEHIDILRKQVKP